MALHNHAGFGAKLRPPTPPTPAQIVANQVARLTKLLDLNSTQQASATTIFTTEQTALAALRTSMQTARTALRNRDQERRHRHHRH